MRQDQLRLGHANHIHRLETALRQQQGIGIGVADIFGSEDEHTPCDKQRIFTTRDHPGQPIHRAIRIAAAHGFDEGRNDVVMLLAGFIVKRHILLNMFQHGIVGDNYLFAAEGIHKELKNIEQFTGVPS